MPPTSHISLRMLDGPVLAVGLLVTGCGILPTFGPTADQVVSQQVSDKHQRYDVVDIDDKVVERILASPHESLSTRFPHHDAPREPAIGIGDSLVVTIWEAAGGGLFASTAAPDQIAPGSRSVTLPEQMVGRDGAISVPFAGRVAVAGHSPLEVQRAIEQRLSGKAIDPQVIVTMTKNVNNTVTVTGEAIGGARVPLSLKGDRLLDLIAAAGGAKTPVYETYVRLSRGGITVTIPLETLVSDPRENIYAEPGDVLTVVRAPHSFTVFGATGQNSDINFPSTTLTLAEALAKAGGLQDSRSDPAGVFLFRYERIPVLQTLGEQPAAVTADGRAPVVYRLDLRDAGAYFAAERFPVEDKDILYVANADIDDIQKFFGLIGTLTAPAITGVVVKNATQ